MKKKLVLIILIAAVVIGGATAAVVAVMNKDSDDAPTWREQYNLGVRYLGSGNYEEAIIAFNAAIEINPKKADAYIGLADAYLGLGDIEGATEVLTEALSNVRASERDRIEAKLAETPLSRPEASTPSGSDPTVSPDPVHTHVWRDATCTEPKTCTECGETEGEPLGHNMQITNDGFPSICSRCGYINGDLVTDAYVETIVGEYGECRFAIPQINIAGETAESINKEIWDELYVGVLEEIRAKRPYFGGEYIKYEWAVNGSILSLWIESQPAWDLDWLDYYVYNVDIFTGTFLSNEDVIIAAGFTPEEYYEKAKQVLGSKYWSNWERDNEQFYDKYFVEMFNQQLRNTVSDENVHETTPFFNSDGQLCFLAQIYSMAGADSYWGIHNIENFEFLPYYAEDAVLLTHNVNITEDEAYKMACDYWNYVPGSIAEETGFELFLVYDGLMEEYDGNHYYSFRLRWWVPMEAGIGNYLSTIDYLYINAETGKCTSYI